MPLTNLAIVLLVLATVLAAVLVSIVYRRRNQTPQAQLRKCCKAMISQVLVPDEEAGQIHIEYALLCPRGIVLLNLKEVTGNVFGSDSMTEWAVITGKRRFAFNNPQDGLYDRVAAVKRLVPDVPVHGHVAFMPTAVFTKGVPSHVAMFDELVAELQAEFSATGNVDAYWPAWETLRKAATPAA